ncbi:hypothetical protein GOODEAATRI_018256 [Goodea atripinnis]|uniref:Uncharacterized protein n=1 Tax=Goodea atripinnis TaxID=208336 RepID=A0ABV0PPL8_9TELE
MDGLLNPIYHLRNDSSHSFTSSCFPRSSRQHQQPHSFILLPPRHHFILLPIKYNLRGMVIFNSRSPLVIRMFTYAHAPLHAFESSHHSQDYAGSPITLMPMQPILHSHALVGSLIFIHLTILHLRGYFINIPFSPF